MVTFERDMGIIGVVYDRGTNYFKRIKKSTPTIIAVLRYVYLSKLHFWVALIGIKAYYFYRDKGLWWKPNGINPFVLVSKEGDCV